MSIALAKLSDEDPTFQVKTDKSSPTLIAGMGELQLDIIVDHAPRIQVECNVGKPQVAYRETIRKPVHSTRSTPTRSRPVVPASSQRCS